MQQLITHASPMPPMLPAEGGQDLVLMDLTTLVRRCVSERETYRRTRQHDMRYGFELFRRALVEKDQLAWEQIYHAYRGLVECWVRRCSAFAHSEESSESCALAALARFARVVTPERFASFPNLAALLRYLRCCTESVVLDSLRAQRTAETLPDEMQLDDSGLLVANDDCSLERIERQEFWTVIMSLLHGEAERVVLLRSFILGMRPSDIYEQRRDLFDSIADVYSVKRNVLVRLRRNSQLAEMLERLV